ncbi:MAG: diguanylate cyclase [Lachnospiraceae bacterium]|nr:diguanylate cyclase [Lachnospiraceae bacterium]
MSKLFNKKFFRTFWLAYSLASVLLVLFLIVNLICSDIDKTSSMLVIDDNWDITINDKVYKNVNLKDFKTGSLDVDDTISLSRVLPDEWDFVSPSLYFFIRHSTLDVYIDNELIHSYGEERLKNGKSLGCGIEFINFSNNYKGKTIRIDLKITEDGPFSKFDSIYITEWSNSYRYFMTVNFVPMLVGSFLVIFGIFVVLFSIFAISYSKKYMNFFLLSLFSICMGLWTLCYHNILAIFSIPIYSISLVEYMSLYIAPIPFLGFMYSYIKMLSNKILTTIYKLLFAIQFLFTSVTITLHTLDLVHAARLQKYFHALLIIHLLFFSFVFIKNIRLNNVNKKSYVFGLAFFAGTVLYDIAGYNLQRSFGLDSFNIKGLSSIGISMLLAILAIDIYRNIAKMVVEENEKLLLIKYAYTDQLTELYNRRYCAEYMNRLDEEQNSCYSIFIFDLNNLKLINDEHGHSVGDKLIKMAADIINNSFKEKGIIGRLGGDEFIAIIETDNKSIIDSLIENFENTINQYNSDNNEFNISIAYGYAISHESPNLGTENTYRLADSRMYECKAKQKTL